MLAIGVQVTQTEFAAACVSSRLMLSEDGADELSGDFEGETTLLDLVVIGNAIRKMAHPQLRKLQLNFKKCEQLIDISALGGAIAALSSLQHLQINFEECSQLSDISALSGSIAALSSLQHLQINFWFCNQLSKESKLMFEDWKPTNSTISTK